MASAHSRYVSDELGLNDGCRFWTMTWEFIRLIVDIAFYVLACCIAHDTPGRSERLARFGVFSWDDKALLTPGASIVLIERSFWHCTLWGGLLLLVSANTILCVLSSMLLYPFGEHASDMHMRQRGVLGPMRGCMCWPATLLTLRSLLTTTNTGQHSRRSLTTSQYILDLRTTDLHAW